MRNFGPLVGAMVFTACAVAQEARLSVGDDEEEKVYVKPYEYHGHYVATIEGSRVGVFEGTHEIECIWMELPDGTPVPIVVKNKIGDKRKDTATPPDTPIPELLVPWVEVLSSGLADTPPPNRFPFPADFTIAAGTLITAAGVQVPLDIQLVTDLTQLPATADFGQGQWTISWPDLQSEFMTLHGRYFLATAPSGIRLGDFGCPLAGCTDAGAYVDFDGDCEVTLSDLTRLLSGFGRNDAAREDGDTNGDGRIDLTDLTTLLSRYGISCH